MPERPLLRLPSPTIAAPPQRRGGGGGIRKPSKQTQAGRFDPTFQRLQDALNRNDDLVLRADPTSLAPERVIVFETAGTVDSFVRAISKVDGFEFLAEVETEVPPDALFANEDTRPGRHGQVRMDKNVNGRLYMAMPDLQAFRELLSLWNTWQKDERLPRGFTPFRDVFEHLRELRPWGIEDRIPADTIAYWQDQLHANPNQPVRTEIELWFHRDEERRRQSLAEVTQIVQQAGGAVIHVSVIPEILYQGMLVDVPTSVVEQLADREDVALAVADSVMFLRPQSIFSSPSEVESETEDPVGNVPPAVHRQALPIAALLDGVPLQGHQLLTGRLILDDPDDLQAIAIVSKRRHGTAMSSLIIHGDLNDAAESLERPLYMRPVMLAGVNDNEEHSEANRLLVDTLYRCIVRIKGTEEEEGVAPSVFLVNLSVGDPRRPFAGTCSPLARLLDYLSERYGILFLVSAGNINKSLTITGFNNWTEYTDATPDVRERETLRAMNDVKHERTIISPAESINSLTIGASHHDSLQNRQVGFTWVDPFRDHLLPNPTCGLGLGHRRAVKPDLFFPAGREHVGLERGGGGQVTVMFGASRTHGLRAAAPDPGGQGRLDQTALSDGTSSATALATRACHRIFDSLVGDGSNLADLDPEYYAVVVKALLVHRARWSDNSELLEEICGPDDPQKWRERLSNVSRFLGFGVPNATESSECSEQRATFVGYGDLSAGAALSYRIPLPRCLERVTDPRRLTITVGWLSDVKPWLRNYRTVRFEAQPTNPLVALGIERLSDQPIDDITKRGTVFHEHYYGENAVAYIDNGHIGLTVWCKDDAGTTNGDMSRFGLAVTIEADTAIPVYDQIQQRLLIRPRA